MNSVELAQISMKSPDKKRNGDFCKSTVLNDEKLIVLVLADGVGSSPCDWKASQTSCEKFVEEFEKKKNETIAQRMNNALHATNNFVREVGGNCQGMKSTFCATIIDQGGQKLYSTNLGDSRIYLLSGDEIQQISTDHVKSVVLRNKQGKPIVISGTVAVAKGVTKVIGVEDFAFKIDERHLRGIEAVILSSDGFHGIGTKFDKDIKETLSHMDLDQGINKMYRDYQKHQKDDMSLIVARKSGDSEELREILNSLLEGNRELQWQMQDIARAIYLGLEDGLDRKDRDEVLSLLGMINEMKIDFSRERIGNLIGIMGRNNFQDGEIYRRLRELLTKSRIN